MEVGVRSFGLQFGAVQVLPCAFTLLLLQSVAYGTLIIVESSSGTGTETGNGSGAGPATYSYRLWVSCFFVSALWIIDWIVVVVGFVGRALRFSFT